jgi:hypothetical protein
LLSNGQSTVAVAPRIVNKAAAKLNSQMEPVEEANHDVHVPGGEPGLMGS